MTDSRKAEQWVPDVLGGNWSGMFTIMVRPISDNALPHTRFTRRLERPRPRIPSSGASQWICGSPTGCCRPTEAKSG